jgi:hypothetical protein
VFSWDGRRIAYAAQIDHQGRVVIEGEPGPTFARILVAPVVCADGHLRYLAAEAKAEGTMLVRVTVPGFSVP